MVRYDSNQTVLPVDSPCLPGVDPLDQRQDALGPFGALRQQFACKLRL